MASLETIGNTEFVELIEYDTSDYLNQILTEEEIQILETEFKNKLELIYSSDGRQSIKASQYIGYIVLPNHVISIRPKIPEVSFINMIRYALHLPKLMTEVFSVSEEVQRQKNYYDILVKFLLYLTEPLLQQGLYNSYGKYEENLMSVRGKILFKENLLVNYNRPDKIFCNYSELTADILENRIIKYTLFHLSIGHFFDDSVSVRIRNCYKRFDQVEVVPIHSDYFKSIQYTPLNEHYRPIISLCELLLSDSSLDLETIGERTAISFLLDMNKLFEKFIANLLAEKIDQFDVKMQETEYADITENKLKVIIDIKISQNGVPSLILDTKYKEFEKMPEEGKVEDVAQIVLHSISIGVKKIGLIYVGRPIKMRRHGIKSGTTLYILCFNLISSCIATFEQNCSSFVEDVKSILADGQQPI